MAKINTNIKGYNLKETGDEVEELLQEVGDLEVDLSRERELREEGDIKSAGLIGDVEDTVEAIADGTAAISPQLDSGTKYGNASISAGLDMLAATSWTHDSEFHISDTPLKLDELTVQGITIREYHGETIFNIDDSDVVLTNSKYSGYTSLAQMAQRLASMSSAYVASGSVANLATLKSAAPLTAANVGKVYNIESDFTTDSDFLDGAGKTLKAGTNVVVV